MNVARNLLAAGTMLVANSEVGLPERKAKMSLKLTGIAGVSLLIFPSIALALSPTATLTSRPRTDSVILVAEAESGPAGIHVAIEWTRAKLSEIDGTIAALEQDARKLDKDARKGADAALQKLRATREAYRVETEVFLADARQKTDGQIVETRAKLEARWNEFEHELEGYLATINSELALRKAVFQARAKAQELYWQGTIAELKTSTTAVAAERRAAIEAKIAELQAFEEATKAKLSKLEQSGNAAWSTLQDGLIDARQEFDKRYNAIKAAIKDTKQ
jgi:hypothetical protein